MLANPVMQSYVLTGSYNVKIRQYDWERVILRVHVIFRKFAITWKLVQALFLREVNFWRYFTGNLIVGATQLATENIQCNTSWQRSCSGYTFVAQIIEYSNLTFSFLRRLRQSNDFFSACFRRCLWPREHRFCTNHVNVYTSHVKSYKLQADPYLNLKSRFINLAAITINQFIKQIVVYHLFAYVGILRHGLRTQRFQEIFHQLLPCLSELMLRKKKT